MSLSVFFKAFPNDEGNITIAGKNTYCDFYVFFLHARVEYSRITIRNKFSKQQCKPYYTILIRLPIMPIHQTDYREQNTNFNAHRADTKLIIPHLMVATVFMSL